MTFRSGACCALSLLAVFALPGCGDSEPPYAGPGLPKDYKKFEREPNPVVELTTSLGPIKIELFEDRATNTVNNFVELVEKDFYKNVIFNRVLKDTRLETGDPLGTGTGGPGYKFSDEIESADNKNIQYAVGMDSSGGPNTNGSRFYIVTNPKGIESFDRNHTVFGKVIEGKDVVDKINLVPTDDAQKPVTPVVIQGTKVVTKRNHNYKLDEANKTPDPKPQTLNLGPGTYKNEEIQKRVNELQKTMPATTTKPADTKPADTKPADTKPADTKPADTKPADTKPATPAPKSADTPK